MQAHLFQTISQRLSSLPAIQWIDWNQGQVQNKYLLTPAVLLSIARLSWQDNLENTQEGQLTLHVDIYLSNMFATQRTQAGKATISTRTYEALSLLPAIVERLHGFGTEQVLGLVRTEENSLHNPKGNLWGFRQTYCSSVIDRTRLSNTRTVPVSNLRID